MPIVGGLSIKFYNLNANYSAAVVIIITKWLQNRYMQALTILSIKEPVVITWSVSSFVGLQHLETDDFWSKECQVSD